jgi:hypothetical protein
MQTPLSPVSEGLEFARGVIQKALEKRCDIVFIDEPGHLELVGKGIVASTRLSYHGIEAKTTHDEVPRGRSRRKACTPTRPKPAVLNRPLFSSGIS